MTAEAAPRVVHARAPAKINVFLKVGALLEDGYHEVATAYQAVSLAEEVRASEADDFSVKFSGPIDVSNLATDGSNLAIKAATLLACDALWGTDLSREELLDLATQLGSDVPFAFTGGTAIGTGRGDQLSPALAKGQFQWVLALADFGMSTPLVYRELDLHRDRHSQDIFPAAVQPQVDANVLQALRAGDPQMLAEALHNDLQAPALHLEPELAAVIELGEENGALAGMISGSGPTVAFLAADLDGALELQIALSAARLRVVRATGPVHGARIVSD